MNFNLEIIPTRLDIQFITWRITMIIPTSIIVNTITRIAHNIEKIENSFCKIIKVICQSLLPLSLQKAQIYLDFYFNSLTQGVIDLCFITFCRSHKTLNFDKSGNPPTRKHDFIWSENLKIFDGLTLNHISTDVHC